MEHQTARIITWERIRRHKTRWKNWNGKRGRLDRPSVGDSVGKGYRGEKKKEKAKERERIGKMSGLIEKEEFRKRKRRSDTKHRERERERGVEEELKERSDNEN